MARGHVTLDRPRSGDVHTIANVLRALEYAAPGAAPSRRDAAETIAGAGPQDHAIRLNGDFAGMVGTSGERFVIWTDPVVQGRGLATRAAVIALTRAFVAGAARIVASHDPGDHRAGVMLARLGFRRAREAGDTTDQGPVALTLTGADFAARHPVTVTTQRLVIDELRPSDRETFHRIVTQPDVARMLLRFRPDMTLKAIEPMFPTESLIPPYRLTARLDGRVIGSVGLGAGAAPEIYYFIHPSVAGGGLASEMVAGFCSEIIDRYGFAALSAEVFQDNPASRHILEKNGFAVVSEHNLKSHGRSAPAPAWVMRRGE